MARSKNIQRCATLALLASTSIAQPGQRRDRSTASTVASVSSTSSSPSSSSSTSAAPPGFTTAVVPIYLVDIAESLYTKYFPSTTPLDLAHVAWPTQVVIGDATYGLQAKATPTASQQTSSPTAASSSSGHKSNQESDKRLAIILGSVIGAVALAVMVVIFCCLRRRKENTGSFFMRRSTPSTSSKGSRFANVFGGHTSYGPDGEHGRSIDDNTPIVAAAALRPGMQQHSNRSSSDENPFYTPHERLSRQLAHQELDGRSPGQASGGEIRDSDRPPTPFLAGLMRKPVPSRQPLQNPFASPEDREADDVVSPILPSKSQSFERMNSHSPSPMIHYPSMSEVSEFDFAGEGSNSARGSGGNAWYPARERVSGRHELA